MSIPEDPKIPRQNQPPTVQSPKKQRLDLLLVERELAESREQAKRLIMAGEVLVDDVVRDKAGQLVAGDAPIRVRNRLPYVSRGGQKLEAALDNFALDVTGLIALDVGASTGGFTDCLLQRGAASVYAVDVGYGQLAWKLRSDPRVVTLERTNVRNLQQLPDNILADLAVIDASFISLALVLPATLRLVKPTSQIVALIKPQFEAGKDQVGKGGVVRAAVVHRKVIEENCALAMTLALSVMGLTISPLLGPAGNVEFLAWYQRSPIGPPLPPPFDIGTKIDQLLDQAIHLRKHS
jgi:23S rRNA (cytidine1920-2'-O)/16S rRNA (cytidine1409-2'-O)-methyltransferase